MCYDSKIVPWGEWFQMFLCHVWLLYVNDHFIVVDDGDASDLYLPLFLCSHKSRILEQKVYVNYYSN